LINPNVTEASKLRFSAGITINHDIKSEGEIRSINIPKGLYVTARFEIKAEEISTAWKSMCIWVIENNYEFRDSNYFEIYLNDHKTHPEQKFILDICIPLQRTKNIQLGTVENEVLSDLRQQNKSSENFPDYHELINYMKELRAFFHKQYDGSFKLGKLYRENPDFSYFSLTTEALKKLKLKFVIVLHHQNPYFLICLSGQNKSIRKKYWEMFKNSDWNKYHLAESIDDSLSIIDQTIVEKPDFGNKSNLTQIIESKSLDFVHEIKSILK